MLLITRFQRIEEVSIKKLALHFQKCKASFLFAQERGINKLSFLTLLFFSFWRHENRA